MIDNEELDADDFIPDENEEKIESIDIHALLFNELTELLSSKHSNDNLAVTAWLIGERLRRTLAIFRDEKKAKQAFKGLQRQIAEKFGKEYTKEKLYECLKLADDFPDMGIFSEYTQALSLDHFKLILTITSDMARIYYCEMCKQENWSVEVLKQNIDEKTFEKEYGE